MCRVTRPAVLDDIAEEMVVARDAEPAPAAYRPPLDGSVSKEVLRERERERERDYARLQRQAAVRSGDRRRSHPRNLRNEGRHAVAGAKPPTPPKASIT
jgi:hypothetical protein